MEITFSSSKLAKIFNSRDKLVSEYGEQKARTIMIRLSILESAQTLADVPYLPPVRCHPLKGNREGQFAVDISRNFRLVFQLNCDPVPRKEDHGIDRTQIKSIVILGVEDYH